MSSLTEIKYDESIFELAYSDILPALTIINKTTNSLLPAAMHAKYYTFQAEEISSNTNFQTRMLNFSRRVFSMKPCGELINKTPYQKLLNDEKFKNIAPIIMSCIELHENDTLPVFSTRFDRIMKFLRTIGAA